MRDAQMAEDWIVPLTISSREREFISVLHRNLTTSRTIGK